MALTRHIPNALTCGNLLCGCVGLRAALTGNLTVAAWLIGLAAVFDFFDGFAARALRVHSPIGKELDSLADMVTFGVLPGAVAFRLLETAGAGSVALGAYAVSWAHVALLIPVCSALRLAKFNVDTRQTDQFIGLPTPANALLWASLPLILTGPPGVLHAPLGNAWVVGGLVVGLSALLVAELPLFALKFKNYRPADNKIPYLFLVLSLAFIFAFSFAAVPLIVLLYVLLSVIYRTPRAS